jgi:signal transduction histidine kinase
LGVTLPVAVVSTLAIAVRTRFPVAVAGVIAAMAVTQALATGHASGTLWALVVFLVSAYTVAAERDEGWASVGLGLVLGAQFLCEWRSNGTDYPFDTLVFGGVWLFGRGTRSWRNQATYAQQHQQDLALLAVAEERTRIARELHDVVAHSLSVIAVQADAAEAALAKDPGRAGAPLRAIRGSAREALSDMRQLLQVLRTDDADDRSPARGIADLDQLVAGMRASGLPVEAEIRVGSTLPAGLGLAVYRIAQEGLTNVRKHAGTAPTRLCVDQDGPTVRVQVCNEAPTGAEAPVGRGLSTGHGLLGVRERIRAAGGSLRSGPTESGGFELVAVLPIEVPS